MITFLKCEAESYFALKIKLSFSDKDGTKEKEFYINSMDDYKISVVDSKKGLVTYFCRIVGFTLCNKPDPKSFVNFDKKGNVEKFCNVDTIKIDYSDEGKSGVRSINIGDIRNIECYGGDGFVPIDKIKEFR